MDEQSRTKDPSKFDAESLIGRLIKLVVNVNGYVKSDWTQKYFEEFESELFFDLDHNTYREDVEKLYRIVVDAAEILHHYCRERNGAKALDENTCPFCSYIHCEDGNIRVWAARTYHRNI